MDAITWPLLERGFNAAGAMNIVATMACGRCFTGAALPAAWPGAFGTEGQAALVLFGGCYIAAAPSLRPGREKQPWTYAVLCAEKLFFASAWAFWARQQRPSLGWQPPPRRWPPRRRAPRRRSPGRSPSLGLV